MSQENRKPYVQIEDTPVYMRFRSLAKDIWFEVITWDYFAKITVGKQLVTSADSVPANLAEGDGRYSDTEAIRFFYIARGSARELQNWISVAVERDLVSPEVSERWCKEIVGASQELNGLINYRIKTKVKGTVREDIRPYGSAVVLDDEMEADDFIDDQTIDVSTAARLND